MTRHESLPLLSCCAHGVDMRISVCLVLEGRMTRMNGRPRSPLFTYHQPPGLGECRPPPLVCKKDRFNTVLMDLPSNDKSTQQAVGRVICIGHKTGCTIHLLIFSCFLCFVMARIWSHTFGVAIGRRMPLWKPCDDMTTSAKSMTPRAVMT